MDLAVLITSHRAQDVRIKVAAAHQHHVAVLQDVTVPQLPQLHSGIMAGATDRGVLELSGEAR